MSPDNTKNNIEEIILDFCKLAYSSNPRDRRACSEWFMEWMVKSKKSFAASIS
jgi:hypothetical protein